MSEFKELLEAVNIEWKNIGEISELYGGLKGKSKKDFTDGNAKFVSYKNIFNNIQIDLEALENVNVSPNENQYSIRYGDVLFTGSSEIASEAGMSSSVTKSFDTEIYLNSFSFGLRFNSEIKLIPEFTKYLFRSKFMRDAIAKTASGVTRYNVSKKRFLKLEIPIPYPDNPEKSLEIQQGIVRILDSLSEETNQLTEALQKELDLHQKKYNYYREELFKFDGKDVEWKVMEQVLKIKNGKDYKSYKKGEVPVYGSGGIMTFIDTYVFNKPSVLIPRKGSLKNLFYVMEPFWTVDTIFWTDINMSIVEPKYVFHFLSTKRLEEFNVAGGVPSLTQTVLNKIPIPVPTIQEQNHIIKSLDDLDAKTQAITSAIKKEIALRNKQYEYYRDQLLSFPK